MSSDSLPADDYALELRAELLRLFSGSGFVRRGESDRLEIGRGHDGSSSDTLAGHEEVVVGGDLRETTGHSRTTVMHGNDLTVDGSLDMHGHSETTLLGGGVRETHMGAEFLAAGMSDDLVAGVGARVTAPFDIWLCGLFGMEENIGVVAADGVLSETYGVALDREFIYGMHNIGTVVLSGMLYNTQASGMRALLRSNTGVSNVVPGAGAGSGSAAAPGAPPPAPDPSMAAGVAINVGRVGRNVEGGSTMRNTIDLVAAARMAGDVEDIENIENTRMADGARLLGFTDHLSTSEDFLASDEVAQFLGRGDDVIPDGTGSGSVVDDLGEGQASSTNIYESPWEQKSWYRDELLTNSRVAPDVDDGGGFGQRLDFQIAELDALRADLLDDGDVAGAEAVAGRIRFLERFSENLDAVDAAGNPVYSGPLEALGATYDELSELEDSAKIDNLGDMRDEMRRLLNDPTLPSPSSTDQQFESLYAPGAGLTPDQSGTDRQFESLYGSAGGGEAPSPGAAGALDGLHSKGIGQTEFEGLYARIPVDLPEPDGIYNRLWGSENPYDRLWASENPYDRLAHFKRMQLEDLPAAGNVGEDAAELENLRAVLGPSPEDGSVYAKLDFPGDGGPIYEVIPGDSTYDVVRAENISNDSVYDVVRQENIIEQPIYDEIAESGTGTSTVWRPPAPDLPARPEHIYTEFAGSPGPVWRPEGPPVMTRRRVNHDYEDLTSARYGGSGEPGPIWRPAPKTEVPMAPRESELGIERAMLAGRVPEGADTTELADGWRGMEALYRQQAADLAARGRPGEAANVDELANVHGRMAAKLEAGEFDLNELRQISSVWTQNTLDFPDNAQGAQAVAGMLGDYQKLLNDTFGYRTDSDWLAAVARLDAAKQAGDTTDLHGAQRALGDLFDDKFPPPSWLDGQRPVGEDIYSTAQVQMTPAGSRWKAQGGGDPLGYDASRAIQPDTMTLTMPDGQEYLDWDRVWTLDPETLEEIRDGTVVLEIRGTVVTHDGTVIHNAIISPRSGDPLDYGELFKFASTTTGLLRPPDDLDEFMKTWHADRAARLQRVGNFLEDGGTGASDIENVRPLLNGVPDGHGGVSADDGMDLFQPAVFPRDQPGGVLLRMPTPDHPEFGEHMAKYYSRGPGRGAASLDPGDVNVPIDDVASIPARVEVSTLDDVSVTPGVVSGNLFDDAPKADVFFSPPPGTLEDPDTVMDAGYSAQKMLAAVDPDGGRAKVSLEGSSAWVDSAGLSQPDELLDAQEALYGDWNSVVAPLLDSSSRHSVEVAPEPQVVDDAFVSWFEDLGQRVGEGNDMDDDGRKLDPGLGTGGTGGSPARVVTGGTGSEGTPLPVGFDRQGAIGRLDEEMALQNDELRRLKIDPDVDPQHIARVEAEIDARQLARTEIEAGRDPRAALSARADDIDASGVDDAEIAAAYRDTAGYFGGSGAFATTPRPEVSFDNLLADWRERIVNADSIADNLRPRTEGEIERAEAYSDVASYMRQGVIDVTAGRDPRAELLRHVQELEARPFVDGETGAGEASMLRTMIAEYNALTAGA